MRKAHTTFFERIVTALDRDKAEQIARVEAGVDTFGMSRLDINYAILRADGNGTSDKSEHIRAAILEYVRNVL